MFVLMFDHQLDLLDWDSYQQYSSPTIHFTLNQAMSNNNMRSLRRGGTTSICLARQGKPCRCTTCSSSFASTATTVSDVSTTCPPSEIDDRESVQDFE
ncbi:unnamed protein product, partial [Rhizoctonia solani]